MQITAILLWHKFAEGKLIGYETTVFEGNRQQLSECMDRAEFAGNQKNGDQREKETMTILMQVIITSPTV